MRINVDFIFKVFGAVILLGTSQARAATQYYSGYVYTYQLINNGTEAEIYKATSTAAISPLPAGIVTLPSTLGGVPVTSIGSYALYNCQSFYSVTIPASVKSIGQSAFSGCTGLISVNFSSPSTLTNIGVSAFYNCSALPSISLPDSIKTIQGNAFNNCTNLATFTIPASIEVISDTVFTRTKLTSIIIPTNITSIGFSVFNECTGLTNVTFSSPSAVKTIGQQAFEYCGGLSSITIPNSVTNIGNGAFKYCYALRSVEIPDSVTALPSELFYYCTNLVSFTIPSTATSIGSYAFAACTGLSAISIPASVKTIGDYGFTGCSGLTSVNFSVSSGLTTIGNYGFNACSSLSSIEIPSSVSTIGAFAFRYCSALASVSIPGSVTYLGQEAFRYCSVLQSVTFRGNKPATVGSNIYLNTPALTTYVPVGSTGWGVSIPGTWQLKTIRYFVVVSFDSQGGSVPPPDRNVGVSQTYGTLPVVTRDGYVFGGWFTQPNGEGTEITASTAVTTTSPHTLYAKWAVEPPVVIIGGEAVTNSVSTNFLADVTQEQVDAAISVLTNRYPEITAVEVGALSSIADAMGVSMALLATETNIVLFSPKLELSAPQLADIEETGSISLSFTVDNGITDTTEAMRLLEQSVSKRIHVVVMSSLFETGTAIEPSFEFKDGKCTVVFTLESPLPSAFFRVDLGNTQ